MKRAIFTSRSHLVTYKRSVRQEQVTGSDDVMALNGKSGSGFHLLLGQMTTEALIYLNICVCEIFE